MTYEIGSDIGLRIFEALTNPGLRAEVTDPVEVVLR
jgi:hypothetical protein